jgi:Ca2+-binding RTX toxin-like protein
MSHARPSLGRHSLVLAIAILLVGAASANATTVSFNGGQLIVSGVDSASHEIQFRFNAATPGDDILDSQPITAPAECLHETDKWVHCPGSDKLKVDLGSGSDEVTFVSQGFDCFNAYELNLGDGANTVNLSSDCGDALTGPAIINSGSGPDVLTAGSQAFTINAGGGNDSVYASPGNDVVHGGDGADRLFGYAGGDQLLGEGGADSPNGGPGNDLVDGGADDDELEQCSGCIGSGNDAGGGADTYSGGSGADRLWLDGHNGGMAISIDGQANDGISGEGDNVGSDIEQIEGTTSGDVFTGSAGPDNFSGGGGSDDIHGGGGNDDLYGGSSDDRVFGDAGNDKLQGASGADSVDGGAGADQMYGDVASCSVFCSLGSDTLSARDGERDSVDCGGGADSAVVDQLDVVAFCASVDRGSVGQAGGPAKPSFAGSKKTVNVSPRGRFTYTFRAGAGLRGKAVFGTLATKSFTVPSSGKVALKVTLKRKKLALLRKKRSIRAKVTVTVKNAAGASSKASKTVTFKR